MCSVVFTVCYYWFEILDFWILLVYCVKSQFHDPVIFLCHHTRVTPSILYHLNLLCIQFYLDFCNFKQGRDNHKKIMLRAKRLKFILIFYQGNHDFSFNIWTSEIWICELLACPTLSFVFAVYKNATYFLFCAYTLLFSIYKIILII